MNRISAAIARSSAATSSPSAMGVRYHHGVPDVETETEDPTEALRIAFMVLGMVLNLWIVYDYVKDRPDVMVARQRAKNWWGRVVTAPEKAAKALRLAEAETVFEAMEVVGDGWD